MGDESNTGIINSKDSNSEECRCQNTNFGLNNLSPNQLATLSNIVAIALSEGRNSTDINVLGNFIIAVGSIMTTIGAQTEALSSRQDKVKQISDLKKQIKDLEDSLCK